MSATSQSTNVVRHFFSSFKLVTVSWYDKIQSLKNKEDGSPELKRGEVKSILIDKFNKYLPEFEFSRYKNNQYNFQRVRGHKGFKIWETLHVLFLLKDKNFSCSVASRLDPTKIDSRSYDTGLINPHVDLITSKKGTGAVSIEEAYYFHNGHIQTTTEVVDEICRDYVQYGLPFLDKQYERIKNHDLINAGFDYLLQLSMDKDDLKAQLQDDLKQAGFLFAGLKHSIYLDFKNHLQSIGGQTNDDRKQIPRLSFDLLNIYCLTN